MIGATTARPTVERGPRVRGARLAACSALGYTAPAAADAWRGVLGAWWRGDPAPALEPIDGFAVAASADDALLARIAQLDPGEVRRRRLAGHRPYVASIGAEPVAYGWAATAGAGVGELGIALALPPGERYLWDFATLPAWRGHGVYPRLLRAMIGHESAAERFWILHATTNAASGRGIERAGFRPVGEVAGRRAGPPSFDPDLDSGRARAGAAIIGLPLPDAPPTRLGGLGSRWRRGRSSGTQRLPARPGEQPHLAA